MRFEKVLLISPPTSSYLGAARPPQNLGYLAKALQENEIEYDVLDMRLGYTLKHLMRKMAVFKPDLIGVTLVSLQYKNTFDLISTVKRLNPDIRTIVGGPHVTALQEKVLYDCPDIDFGVVYEGEDTLVEICQDRLPISEIGGLLHRENGEVIYNGHRLFNKPLDQIAFPTYEKFELERYIREMPFNSSRGCPLRCVFCPNKLITKRSRANNNSTLELPSIHSIRTYTRLKTRIARMSRRN